MTTDMVHNFGDFALFYLTNSLPAILISILLVGYFVALLVTGVNKNYKMDRFVRWVLFFYFITLTQFLIVFGYNMILYRTSVVSPFSNAAFAASFLLIGFHLLKSGCSTAAKFCFFMTIFFIYSILSPYFVIPYLH